MFMLRQWCSLGMSIVPVKYAWGCWVWCMPIYFEPLSIKKYFIPYILNFEALHLLREWEMLQVNDSNYRNHCRLILRCIT